MVLTHGELESLVQVRHRSPHTLLGMHPLGDGSGVVVRAFVPDAAHVSIEPVHEKKKPRIQLKRIHEAGVFEGVSREAGFAVRVFRMKKLEHLSLLEVDALADRAELALIPALKRRGLPL